MPLYRYLCEMCDLIHTELRSMDERDLVPKCPNCGDVIHTRRLLEVPGIMLHSYLDGARHRASPGFTDLQRAARLEVQAASLPPSQRGELNKEIKELKKSRASGPSRS